MTVSAVILEFTFIDSKILELFIIIKVNFLIKANYNQHFLFSGFGIFE